LTRKTNPGYYQSDPCFLDVDRFSGTNFLAIIWAIIGAFPPARLLMMMFTNTPFSIAVLKISTVSKPISCAKEMQVLFGQDVHGPIHPDLKSNAKDYQRSLELMASLEADILCEGHYGIYRGKKEVADFIKQFIAK
jgi:hypothetical protein